MTVPTVDLAEIGRELGELVAAKGEAYGDSVTRSQAILRTLYPGGILPHQYRDALLVVRILDKLSRIATDPGAFDEDPWADIAGYGMLGVRERRGGAPVETRE